MVQNPRGAWEPRHVRARFDTAARAAAARICRAGDDFNFSRRQPRPCGSPHAVRPRIRNRWRDRHKCARVYLFCGGLRIRVRVSVMRTRARHMDCSAAAFVAVAFTAAITISPASAQAADVQAQIDSLGVAPQRLTPDATSGLILFTYLGAHLTNHALGLISLDTAERGMEIAVEVWYSVPGTLLLYGAAATHFVLALWSVYERRTFRLPPLELLRIALGFTLPLILLRHAANTRVACA